MELLEVETLSIDPVRQVLVLTDEQGQAWELALCKIDPMTKAQP